MIIVKLWGGLGNQLFQYAFGYALAKERGTTLVLDTLFYKNQPGNVGKRKIEVDKMSILPYDSFNRSAVLKILNNKYVGAVTRTFPRFEVMVWNKLYYFKEPEHRFVEVIPNHPNIYLDGYWQSSDYFVKYRKEICQMFRAADGYSEEVARLSQKVNSEMSVAIHMRKGDFGNGALRKVGHPLNRKYYRDAIGVCRKKLNTPTFYVFSDNAEWARSVFDGNETDIVLVSDLCKTDALDDLYLISSCRNGIMSASTFSWWGNWLREEPGLVVVPDGEYYNERFYEKEWVRM